MTTASNSQAASGDEYLGKTLDERYRLDEVLGSGAIGKVYGGTQLAVDRKVAIKLLHSAVQGRELGTERFLREAKAVARLSDSSCLTLFDFGFDETLNCLYMVTEFVDGITLAEWLSAGRLGVDQIYYVLFQVATALAHAHECGILHRDLKPENIMLVRGAQGEAGSFETVKVLDFGLARIREEASSRPAASSDEDSVEQAQKLGEAHTPEPFRLTHFGELNGTPAYMSPEQCRGDLDLTPACDYYALGVLAYELFEGHLPYQAEGVAKLLSMHLEDPIPPMQAANIPTDVEELIYRLMGKNPDHRLQSSKEVLLTLRAQMTPEFARDVSLTSLDRFRAPTPESQVAIADAETLVGFDPEATPISQVAAISHNAEPQAGAEKPLERRFSRGIFVALLIVILVGIVGLVLWGMDPATNSPDEGGAASATMMENADKPQDESIADDGAREIERDLDKESVVETGNARSTSLDDAGRARENTVDAPDREVGVQPTSPSTNSPSSEDSAPAKSRPRKLELTY